MKHSKNNKTDFDDTMSRAICSPENVALQNQRKPTHLMKLDDINKIISHKIGDLRIKCWGGAFQQFRADFQQDIFKKLR